MEEAFEKIVTVSPGFDKRHPDPAKNYGIGSCRIFFVLKGSKGAVQFVVGTNWFPIHLQKSGQVKSIYETHPQGWDVGYHSPAPMYEGQGKMSKCDTLPGGCYYDGSSLRADDWIPQFIEGGTDWLWKELEKEYFDRFGDPA